jgi:hypothetical protein
MVWASHTKLRSELERLRPRVGEMLLVRFEGERVGENGRAYFDYTLRGEGSLRLSRIGPRIKAMRRSRTCRRLALAMWMCARTAQARATCGGQTAMSARACPFRMQDACWLLSALARPKRRGWTCLVQLRGACCGRGAHAFTDRARVGSSLSRRSQV